uniref:Large ribosomal subunit protein uL6c n=1 Tax=Porphyridium sordidum TaxID=28024 RepID=A0A1C9CE62_PORSO|nr:ribosomal protein L6 [Porphyridium sordidum]AOM66652.1 ribosomal protein L6 [Porphyridium sordidum]
MSRIGKKPVVIPDKVDVKIHQKTISCKGPKGELFYNIPDEISVEINGNEIQVQKKIDNLKAQALFGMSRTIINNNILGVSQGFSKRLEIKGVGYRSQIEGKNLILNLGFSHPVKVEPPKDITLQVENNTNIIVNGVDKQVVGQTAAYIRSIRPPEPYKGKGVRYQGEVVKLKAGKTGKK